MANIDINFLVGCIGAAAPETWRLYNLRTQAIFRWSWGYLLFSIPFIILGGFIAWILEPTSKWAAFYSGLTAPVLLATAMKDAAKAQKELEDIEAELSKYQLEQRQLMEENQNLKEVVKTLYQKVNPQDLEPIEAALDTKTRKMSSQSISIDGAFVAQHSTQASKEVQTGRDYTSSDRVNISFLPLVGSILGIVASSSIIRSHDAFSWEIIFSILRISMFFLLGMFALIAIITLLKRLQQNRSFKEFLKGL